MVAVPGSTAARPRTMPIPMKKALLAVFSFLLTTLGCVHKARQLSLGLREGYRLCHDHDAHF